MSNRTQTTSPSADRSAAAHSARLARSLIAKTVAFFVANQAANLSKVRDRLLALLDTGLPVVQAQNMRSAYAILGKHSDVFFRAFENSLQAALEEEFGEALPHFPNSGFHKPASASSMDGMSLSLIDLSEVERVMLVDRVAQRFTAHYDLALHSLTQRLGVLFAQESLALSGNPLRPELFVRAFIKAWEKCEFDDQATDELALSLVPTNFIDLAPLYEDLNTTLEHGGVLAQTSYRIRKSAGGSSKTDSAPAPLTQSGQSNFGALQTGASSGQASTDQNPSAWSSLAPVGRQVVAQTRQFLHRLGFGAQSAQGAQEGPMASAAASAAMQARQEAPDSQFLGYLGDLQAGAWSSPDYQHLEGQDPAAQNILRQMRDMNEVRRAPELDRGTVDALAEVFDYVFADQAIPLQLKYVIGRLQIPVLKAAMIDRDFFLSAEHPARKLVDTLANASVAWAPEKGEADPLYLRIESTVQRVLNEFEDDLELFGDLLAEFAQFLFETELQVQGRIEPVAAQEGSNESFDQARAHGDEIVHARLAALAADSPVLRFLAPFLTGQWREVIARAWLNSDKNPAQWDKVVKAMDQLIWSIQPKTTPPERRDLIALLPDLVKNLNAGLDAIQWEGDQRSTFTKRLISTHMLAIRMTQPAALEVATDADDENAADEALKELDERRADKLVGPDDDFDNMAHSLSRGQWFDFLVDGTTQHRCRLTWVSPMRTRLLFTNSQGFDAFVRSEREVAELLRRRQLTLIDQQPVVGRALEWLMAAS